MLQVLRPLTLLEWLRSSPALIFSALNFLVFAFLDFADSVLCVVYRIIDGVVEESPASCYCWRSSNGGEEDEEISETLYERKNMFRRSGYVKELKKAVALKEKVAAEVMRNRWSDCGCEICVLPEQKAWQKLHFIVKESSKPGNEVSCRNPQENVIFIHGFLSSSSWWAETVFPNLSEASSEVCFRMFAVDLFGFGKSPKPMDSKYRLKDHLKMIEESVIRPFHLESFHLVAHSMGCIIALALAAKYPDIVKSITLVAPPYLSSSEENPSVAALNLLAARKIWPPLSFGSAVMSWYEHLGRTVCFLYCRNHVIWELILKPIIMIKRNLSFLLTDMTKHTHHSAWHTMHNLICAGAKYLDTYLEIIRRKEIALKLIHGDKDRVVPPVCSYNLKQKVPLAELEMVANADHATVILGRDKIFTKDLEEFWLISAKCKKEKIKASKDSHS